MSGAQKQRLNEILWMIWFDEKIHLSDIYITAIYTFSPFGVNWISGLEFERDDIFILGGAIEFFLAFWISAEGYVSNWTSGPFPFPQKSSCNCH